MKKQEEITVRKMALENVNKGKIEKPVRLLLFGQPGVGKTSFASAAPAPIFIPAEEGTNNLDVARFPRPESWGEVLDAVRILTLDQHEYKTLVIDTIDAIEPLCWQLVCDKASKRGKDGPIDQIEQLGYGRGYVAALDEWRRLLAALERLWTIRNMAIIMIAHAIIKPFKNPEGEDYDRWQLRIHDKAAGLVKEWVDAILFARFEAYANRREGDLKAKGVSSGNRIIQTEHAAAYDAKNRFDLPPSLPLDWQMFVDAMHAHSPAKIGTLLESIESNLKFVDSSVVKNVRAAMEAAKNDAAELARINNKLAAMVTRENTNA